MNTDMDSVAYCRFSDEELDKKINENQILMYLFYYHIKIKYGCGYPHWCLSGYGYWKSIFPFPTLCRKKRLHAWLQKALVLKHQWTTCISAIIAWSCLFILFIGQHAVLSLLLLGVTVLNEHGQPLDSLVPRAIFSQHEKH